MSDDQSVIMVTGGSRGIGRAIVEALVEQGKTVAFTWRSAEDEAARVAESSHKLAHPFHLDLADRGRPAELVSEIEERLGVVDGLVNNAGIQRSELLAMTGDESWDEVIDVNLGGAFRCCRAVLRSMVSRRRGAIVNVASLSAVHGVAGHSAYAASKAGMIAMTRCVAREMGKRSIRVNAVVPGYVETDMTASLPEQAVAQLRASEVLRCGTSPAAVAEAVLFLLSDRAAAITGQVLTVDAGTTA
jgi:3-oxoacyl-[acyl-carrier protein] reductase